MSVPRTPALEFKRLEEKDWPLLAGLAAAGNMPGDPKSETFGLGGGAPDSPGVELWGLYVGEGLIGGAWFVPASGGMAEIRAMVVARSWWRAGLSTWMLRELSRAAGLGGAAGVVVRLDEGSEAVGETLEEAGFTGPDSEDDGYPAGTWENQDKPGELFTGFPGNNAQRP